VCKTIFFCAQHAEFAHSFSPKIGENALKISNKKGKIWLTQYAPQCEYIILRCGSVYGIAKARRVESALLF
jgi:hypothetical protein